jgi:two-component system LytT family response regulator
MKHPDTPVRAMIVDDEPVAREAVRALLAEHATITVVGEAANGREAAHEIQRLKPDLLFLDIQMPDEDGFALLERLGSDVPTGVIFVTAHDQHAVRAFEVHALDYLLKPFGRPRFAAAVDACGSRRRCGELAGLRSPRRWRCTRAG